ncbi:MAG: hypothetical protein M3Y77_11585 [Actinomycetota bacterium]|nr:hypothetical protein [Actinomycetota bacterium]
MARQLAKARASQLPSSTFNAGIAEVAQPDALIHDDERLYRAKDAGKSRIGLADELVSSVELDQSEDRVWVSSSSLMSVRRGTHRARRR